MAMHITNGGKNTVAKTIVWLMATALRLGACSSTGTSTMRPFMAMMRLGRVDGYVEKEV
jgi:hypothetical protein